MSGKKLFAWLLLYTSLPLVVRSAAAVVAAAMATHRAQKVANWIVDYINAVSYGQLKPYSLAGNSPFSDSFITCVFSSFFTGDNAIRLCEEGWRCCLPSFNLVFDVFLFGLKIPQRGKRARLRGMRSGGPMAVYSLSLHKLRQMRMPMVLLRKFYVF